MEELTRHNLILGFLILCTIFFAFTSGSSLSAPAKFADSLGSATLFQGHRGSSNFLERVSFFPRSGQTTWPVRCANIGVPVAFD